MFLKPKFRDTIGLGRRALAAQEGTVVIEHDSSIGDICGYMASARMRTCSPQAMQTMRTPLLRQQVGRCPYSRYCDRDIGVAALAHYPKRVSGKHFDSIVYKHDVVVLGAFEYNMLTSTM